MFPRVAFDRTKYGRPLLVDACPISAIDNFTLGGRSHRLGFHEIVLLTRGRGTLELDNAAIDVASRRVAVTGPNEVRRWRLREPTLDGFVVFFEAGFMNEFFREGRFVERTPLMLSDPARRSLQASRCAFDALVGIASDMCSEIDTLRDDSDHALRAQTYRLLVTLQRLVAPALAAVPRRGPLVVRFEEALEERYATHDRVADYAGLLGVSRHHLNACVRESSGVTAREAIHRRRYLEACRLLLHTDRSVASISDSLGFSEPSWFIRFFKRHSGTTPGAFRSRRESDISVPASDLRGGEIAGHD